MFGRAVSGTVIGVDAHEVVVEASRGKGLPGPTLIGLARGAVRESMVRVRAAALASSYAVLTYRLVVNLLPAELPKDASALDLALAAALLASSGAIDQERLQGRRFFGELSLAGSVQPVRGAVLVADLARRAGDLELFVAQENAAEAAIIPGIRVIGVPSLHAMVEHLSGAEVIVPTKPTAHIRRASYACFSEVHGQQRAKRALEIAAAGGHNLIMNGPPGSGKTMLARRLGGILPPLDADECIEVTRIHSAAGRLQDHKLLRERPFRAPHHTASEAALCGGGSSPKPGEITLAHRGILFLDELPEFPRRALESLREPLEEGRIHIARAAHSLTFPAEVVLVAAMNPCPCGRFQPDLPRAGGCICSFDKISRYRSRVSGPLLDRIDLHVDVAALPFRDLAMASASETSESIRRRVFAAREIQWNRLDGHVNAKMKHNDVRRFVPLNDETLPLIEHAMDRYGLSARAVVRVLKVARTIADLAAEAKVSTAHVREALGFRVRVTSVVPEDSHSPAVGSEFCPQADATGGAPIPEGYEIARLAPRRG